MDRDLVQKPGQLIDLCLHIDRGRFQERCLAHLLDAPGTFRDFVEQFVCQEYKNQRFSKFKPDSSVLG